MASDEKKRMRISDSTYMLMMSVAFLFEALQFLVGMVFFLPSLIPIIGIGFSMFGYLTIQFFVFIQYILFWLWLPRPDGAEEWRDRVLWFIAPGLIEMIPILNFLPFSTGGVIQTARLIRKRDQAIIKNNESKDANALPLERPRATRIRDASLQARASGSPASSISASRASARPSIGRAVA